MEELLVALNAIASAVEKTSSNNYLLLVTMFYTLITGAICYANWRSSNATDKLVSQFRLNNQPCLVMKNISANGTKKSAETKRQLHVNVELANIGDYPALHVFLVGYIKRKYTQYRGSDIVKMDSLPDFIQYIPKDGSRRLGIRFETSEINALVEDLKVAFDLNTERLSANPYKNAYEGSDLVLTVFYKNLLGQWFEIEIVHIIMLLKNTSKNKPAQTTNNINENTIPPKPLGDDVQFSLVLSSDRFSKYTINTVDESKVKKAITPYKEELPHFYNTVMNKNSI